MTADFTVRLDRVFSGPMDLLLHLVREQEVEIHEIEIHRILHAYLEHLKELAELDIEAAGDFVLMAATLMHIKSRSLLPKEELDLEEELDPRDELIQRLMEFRRFRGAAEDLEQRMLDRGRLVERGWHGEVAATRPEPMLDLGDLTAWDLLGQWSRLQREILANRPRHIAGDPRPLRFYVHSMAEVLKTRRVTTLRELVAFDSEEGVTNEGLIGSFCAVLELAKLGLVTILQDDIRGDISITLAASSAEEIDEVLASATIDDEVDGAQEAEAVRTLESVGIAVPASEAELAAALVDELPKEVADQSSLGSFVPEADDASIEGEANEEFDAYELPTVRAHAAAVVDSDETSVDKSDDPVAVVAALDAYIAGQTQDELGDVDVRAVTNDVFVGDVEAELDGAADAQSNGASNGASHGDSHTAARTNDEEPPSTPFAGGWFSGDESDR